MGTIGPNRGDAMDIHKPAFSDGPPAWRMVMMMSVIESGQRRRRWLRAALPALLLALCAGCVHEEADGHEARYRYEYWVPAVVGLAGAVAAPAGWFLRTKNGRIGWTLLILGPGALFLGMPSMLCDRLTLNDQGFHVRTGFFGSTAWDVDFNNVGGVRQISEVTTGRRRQTNYYLLFDMKTGGEPVKVALGNQLVKTAIPAILQRVIARGIPVVDQT